MDQRKPWTVAEREILRNKYYILSAEELSVLLPGRSRANIIKQVHLLRKRGWAFAGRFKK